MSTVRDGESPQPANQESGSGKASSPLDEGKPAVVAEVLSARDRKLAALNANNVALEKKLAELQAKHAETLSKLQCPTTTGADQTVKHHIKLLHDYNETRDVGLGLMGLVAENRQCRVQDVMPEFGLKKSD